MIDYYSLYSDLDVEDLKKYVPWEKRTETRLECFMSETPRSYTYGKGKGEREYFSTNYSEVVLRLQERLNRDFGVAYNVCFLNRYDDQQMHLGWHADDSPNIDMNHPIAVISTGAEREIWVRPSGRSGIVPPEDRFLLQNNSLFIMPAGYQATHQHRIPKCDRKCGTRISLTFRRYL